MAWQLLAAALPSAAKAVGTALNKPKQEDYKPQTDYMKKYLSYLRGRTASREVVHQAMQPALRVAGRQGRKMQQQVGYDIAKAGLEGSGIEAQMRLSAGQQTQDALATATDKAVSAQAAETARVSEKAAGITAQIQAEEERAEQAFKTAKSNWKNQLASDIIGGVASVASAGIQQYAQNVEGFNQAKISGAIGADVTYDEFKKQAKTGIIEGVEELGLSDTQLENVSPATYAQYIGANEELVSDLRVSSRYLGGDAGVKQLMEQGFKPKQIARIGKEAHQIFVNNFGNVDDATLSQAIGIPVQTNPGLDDVITSISQDNSAVSTPFDPEGEGYDTKRAEELGYKREDDPSGRGHLPSLDSETGRVLKGKGNKKEWDLMLKKEEKLGNKIVKKDDGYYYSVPLTPKVELPKGFKEGDYDTYPIKEIEGVKYHYHPKTGDPVQTVKGEVKISKSPSEMTAWEQHLKIGGGKSKYFKNEEEFLAAQEKHKDKHKDKQLTKEGEESKRLLKETRAKARSNIESATSKEEEISMMVESGRFAKKAGKLTLPEDELKSEKIDSIFTTVQKFEKGNRADRHNNLGAVVWTKNLQNKYPEIEKGDSFIDSDGVTRYTAKFPNKEIGNRINKQIMQDMLESVGGDTAKFYARWSGLPINSETVQNFAKEVGG